MRNLQKFLWKQQNEWESVLAKFDSTCYNSKVSFSAISPSFVNLVSFTNLAGSF